MGIGILLACMALAVYAFRLMKAKLYTKKKRYSLYVLTLGALVVTLMVYYKMELGHVMALVNEIVGGLVARQVEKL